MPVLSLPKSVRERLGEDAAEAFIEFLKEFEKEIKDDLATRRDIKEIEARIREVEARIREVEARIKEVEARIKEVEARIKEVEANMEVKLARFKVEIIKWVAGFLIAQTAILAGIFAGLLRLFF
ncbi:MAG: LA_3696 family protein [Thermodesulfovibrio sp.]|jgi:septal ring factor EnvC (AmiA/AmiB activator)